MDAYARFRLHGDTRICSECGEDKPLEKYEIRNDFLVPVLRPDCRKCRNKVKHRKRPEPRLPVCVPLALEGFLPMGPTEGGALVASVGCMVEARRRAA